MAPAGKLLTRLSHLFVMSTRPETQQAATSYTSHAIDGINALQQWYDQDTDGLWSTTGWWNSGNCLQVLADFAVLNSDEADNLGLASVMENTFNLAQQTTSSSAVTKTFDTNGLVHASFATSSEKRAKLEPYGFSGFINDYYDDEGWWALALIRSYDYTGEQTYLDQAASIFADMQTGGNTPCGGIYWSKVDDYVNAIANELYLAVAASLANRHSDGSYYQDIASVQWTWLQNSGMINENNTFNDGLDDNCENNGLQVWSYNQGVVLGGLVELSKAAGDSSLLDEAHKIAQGGMDALTVDGVLKEISCEPGCGGDGPQFKGIFMRNLRYLHEASPKDIYKDYILNNADSIWSNNQHATQFGLIWAGPFDEADAARQSSALDAIVAAVAVA
ncbi:glycoside hydrolase family 76 protein [Zalerion maritima]|uniref:Glycoside hydrolase family 76 protein n=1 Tax=Zalerion maritima TaxID=339359 RepID=A0AAD5WWL9_9PEZI|nr:glycoside hydrolase family 76 protein [Zalerion maritima]